MKNLFKTIAIIAVVVVIGFSMTACPTDPGVGSGGAGGRESVDNMTWTAVTNSTFGTGTINAIAYGNGRFVAGGDSYNTSTGVITPKMAYSSDGITWTAVTNSTFDSSEYISAIAYGNGRFVAVGSGGKMAYSSDGITWTAVTNSTFGTSYQINAIAYGSDGNAVSKFVAGGYDYDIHNTNMIRSKMAYSSDGITWTAIENSTLGSGDNRAIAYGGGKFVTVGYIEGEYSSSGKMAYSTDGVNWTAVGDNTFGTNTINAIAYGNGRFVAGGLNGRMAYSQ